MARYAIAFFILSFICANIGACSNNPQRGLEAENPEDTSIATSGKVGFKGIDIDCPGSCDVQPTEATGTGTGVAWHAVALERGSPLVGSVDDALLTQLADDIQAAGLAAESVSLLEKGTLGLDWRVVHAIAGAKEFYLCGQPQLIVDLQISFSEDAEASLRIGISENNQSPILLGESATSWMRNFGKESAYGSKTPAMDSLPGFNADQDNVHLPPGVPHP